MIDGVMLGLAVLFVASRFAHTFIHVGRNWVLGRFYAAGLAFVFVSAMWVWLMLRFVAAGF